MVFEWVKNWIKHRNQVQPNTLETSDTVDSNELLAYAILHILENYPNFNSQHLTILHSHQKTIKIASTLSKGNVKNLSSDDFENVTHRGDFLYCYGVFLSNYGEEHYNVDFLELSVDIFQKSRKYLKKGSIEYALSMSDEGNASSILAEIGRNPDVNYEKSILLCEGARKNGLLKKSHDYALALMREGIARVSIARLGKKPDENFKEAINLFEQSRIEGFIENTPSYGRSLVNEGIAWSFLAGFGRSNINQLEKAIQLYEEAMTKGFEKNNPENASALFNEGVAYVQIAELGKNPIENIEKAISLFKRARYEGFAKYHPNYGNALAEEGLALLRIADFGVNPIDNLKKADDLFEKAMIEGLVKDTRDYARVLMNKSMVLSKISLHGEYPESNLKKAIELCKRARNEGFFRNTSEYAAALREEGTSHLFLAELGVFSVDNYKNAVELYESARIECPNQNTDDYVITLMNEGNARAGLAKLGVERENNLNRAELMYLEAEKFFNHVNDKNSKIKIKNNLGYLNYLRNDMTKAYDYLKEAISSIEEMRTSIKIPEQRKEYFETVIATYKYMVFTCLYLDKNDEAFKYAESAKGRTFLELLASEKKKIRGDPQLINKYQEVLREINEIEAKLISSKDRGTEIKHEFLTLKELHNESDNLLREIKKSDPIYYTVKTVETICLDELSNTLKGRILVEYFLGEKLAIFIVNDGLTIKIVEIGEKEIAKKVKEFRELIGKIEEYTIQGILPHKKLEYEMKAENILKYFYEKLIEPIKENLTKEKEIIIIPHSYLHLIPFQALKGNRYLIEDYKLCFAQSASSLKFLKNSAGKGALVVGNTAGNLANAELEALDVAKHFNTNPILGDDAKKERIMKEITGKEILHFSCHGMFDSFNPALSGIFLADGRITAKDFMDMDMDANLAVISACETALAKIASGDEVEGLVRAIQYGGCRFVIASLWKVSSKSTKELFLEFYKGKGDYIDSMKNAELSLMKSYGFYHWAPFQIYGIT